MVGGNAKGAFFPAWEEPRLPPTLVESLEMLLKATFFP